MKAVQQLFPDYAPIASASNPATYAIAGPNAIDSTTTNSSVLNDQVMDTAITDSLVDALMDEASIFNFWETLNRI
jgi:hypothetical protein